MPTLIIREITPPPERVILGVLGPDFRHRLYHQGSDVLLDVSPEEEEWVMGKLRGCQGLQVHRVKSQVKLGIDNGGD